MKSLESLTCSFVSCTFLPLSTLSWRRLRSLLTTSLVARSFFACWESLSSVSTCLSTRCSVSAFSCMVYKMINTMKLENKFRIKTRYEKFQNFAMKDVVCPFMCRDIFSLERLFYF